MKAIPETDFQSLVGRALAAGVPVELVAKEHGFVAQAVSRWAQGCSRPIPALQDEIEYALRSYLRKH